MTGCGDRLDPPATSCGSWQHSRGALQARGVADPWKELFVFNLYQFAPRRFLVKNGDLTDGQIYDLRKFCAESHSKRSGYPDIPRRPSISTRS